MLPSAWTASIEIPRAGSSPRLRVLAVKCSMRPLLNHGSSFVRLYHDGIIVQPLGYLIHTIYPPIIEREGLFEGLSAFHPVV